MDIYAFYLWNLLGMTINLGMNISGAIWDNTKKSFKKTDIGYKESVIGDTVGDPFKDTTGPCLNSLLKIITIISIIPFLI